MTEADWLAREDPAAMLGWLQVRAMPGHGRAVVGESPSPVPVPPRKLRLALAACCRRVWGSLGPAGRMAVAGAENFATGHGGKVAAASLRSFGMAASAEAGESARNSPGNHAGFAAAWLCQEQALRHPDSILRNCAVTAGYAAASYEECLEAGSGDLFPPGGGGMDAPTHYDTPANRRWRAAHDAERAAQAGVLREVFGNPFRPVRLQDGRLYVGRNRADGTWDVSKANWLTPTVLAIAQAACEDRQPDGLLDPLRLAVLADALEEAGCTEEALLSHLRGLGFVADEEMPNKFRWRKCGPHARGCWALDLLLGKA